MSLSDATIKERYGDKPTLKAIESMLDDMVDTHVVMDWIKRFGSERFAAGYRNGKGDGG